MKCFTVSEDRVREGLDPEKLPYPHILVGNVKIPIRDLSLITTEHRVEPCRNADGGMPNYWQPCSICGELPPEGTKGPWRHSKGGERTEVFERVYDASVMKGREGAPGLVSPRPGDPRAMVLWKVASGFRGKASIHPGQAVCVASWYGGDRCEWAARALAILEPGQQMTASRSGRRLLETEGLLTFDGQAVEAVFGQPGFNEEEGEGEIL